MKLPLWLKIPLIAIVLPITGIVLFLWVNFFIPYQQSVIHATVDNSVSKLEIKLKNIDERVIDIQAQQRDIISILIKEKRNE